MNFGRDTPIVDTVKNCIQIRRHLRAESRESFGNCANRFQNRSKTNAPPVHYVFATHGGVGGTPWDQKYVPSGEIFIDEGFVPTRIGEDYEPDGMTKVMPAVDRAGSHQSWMYANKKLEPIINQALIDTGDSKVPSRTETDMRGSQPTAGSGKF